MAVPVAVASHLFVATKEYCYGYIHYIYPVQLPKHRGDGSLCFR